jgi:uncharacterized protein (TIGR00369 family)
MHQAIPLAKTLGIEVVADRPEEVLEWPADIIGGICAFLNLPEAAVGTTTIDSKTNFLPAVRCGHVQAVSRPPHAGRSVVVVETNMIDAEGRLAARVIQSQTVLRS